MSVDSRSPRPKPKSPSRSPPRDSVSARNAPPTPPRPPSPPPPDTSQRRETVSEPTRSWGRQALPDQRALFVDSGPTPVSASAPRRESWAARRNTDSASPERKEHVPPVAPVEPKSNGIHGVGIKIDLPATRIPIAPRRNPLAESEPPSRASTPPPPSEPPTPLPAPPELSAPEATPATTPALAPPEPAVPTPPHESYTAHLASIAPYIQAAFTQWYEQNTQPALPAFLDHYFGRPPTSAEVGQIEALLERRKAEKIIVEPPQPPRVKLQPGEVYERLACVGEGTYGKVYKARNVETGSFVALKRIRMEGEKEGFPVTAMREIKLLQGLTHRNVVRLVEMMVSKGEPFHCLFTSLILNS